MIKLVGTDTNSDVETATGGINAKNGGYPELDPGVTIVFDVAPRTVVRFEHAIGILLIPA